MCLCIKCLDFKLMACGVNIGRYSTRYFISCWLGIICIECFNFKFRYATCYFIPCRLWTVYIECLNFKLMTCCYTLEGMTLAILFLFGYGLFVLTVLTLS